MRLEIHEAKVEVRKESEIALITGDGRTLPSDLAAFRGWDVHHDVLAIGRSINLHEGRVHHWVNVDGAPCRWWAEHLPLKNDGRMPVRHTLGELDGYDVDWDIVGEEIACRTTEFKWHGSTSLFAVYIAVSMSYGRIVLAGCPLDSKGHWYFGPEHTGPWWWGEDYQVWLEFAKTEDSQKVKSLSGYTAQILGEATKEWCNGI